MLRPGNPHQPPFAHHSAPFRASCALVSLLVHPSRAAFSLLCFSRTPCPLFTNAWTVPPHNPVSSPLSHCFSCNPSPPHPLVHCRAILTKLFPGFRGAPQPDIPSPRILHLHPTPCPPAGVSLLLPGWSCTCHLQSFSQTAQCTLLCPHPPGCQWRFSQALNFRCFASPVTPTNDAFRLVARRSPHDARCA